jgi:hypothetical protein
MTMVPRISVDLDEVALYLACEGKEFIIRSVSSVKRDTTVPFVKKVDDVGEMHLSRIVYRCGKLEFSESRKYVMTLTIKDSPPSIMVELIAEKLVVGRKQSVSFGINVDGILSSGKITMTSPTGLDIDEKFETMVIMFQKIKQNEVNALFT